ncbi:MAG: hypothetical protein Q7S21_04625 [archaeon]|nr:hypothetical protein [archaeon]
MIKKKSNHSTPHMQKGQATLIDIIFASMIFLLLFGALVSFFSSNYLTTQKQQLQSDLESKAFETADQLIRFEGLPSNWEELSSIDDINIFGIASRDRVIDENKLARLSSLALTDYNKLKQKLNIGQYDFILDLTRADSILVSVGINPASNATTVVVRRVVYYRGEEANVSFTLYKLR